MPQSRGLLTGRKVLVVEDNFLIAEHVCSLLEQQGCDVLGPAPRLARALELVRVTRVIDGALLDINLNGELCFPAAAALAERAVPFAFLTGYDDRTIVPKEFAGRPVLPKPLDEQRLIEVIAATFIVGTEGKDT